MSYKNWIVKRVFGLGALLFLMSLFVSCPLGDEFLMPVKRVLISTDLSQYVDAPEAEEYPSPGRSYPGVSVKVEWFEDGEAVKDVFKAGKTYTAHITLKITDSSSSFGDTGSFRYPNAKKVDLFDKDGGDRDPYERVFVVIFEELQSQDSMNLKILEYNLQRYVPVPVAGATPVTSLEQPNFTITVDWGEPITVFEEGNQYHAVITVTVKDNYEFDPKFPFMYPEGTVEEQSGGGEDLDTSPVSRKIQVLYKPTKARIPVESVELFPDIRRPRIGQEPKFVIPAVGMGYMGSVKWWKKAEAPGKDQEENWDPVNLSTVFEKETIYRATVSLYAEAGYTLADLAESKITYSDNIGEEVKKEVKKGENGSGDGALVTVEIEFPTTGGGVPITGPLNLTDFIPKPAAGTTPVFSFFAGDYRGTVEWWFIEEDTPKKMEDATFRPRTVYTATVTLIPIVGYVFPDGSIEVKYMVTNDEGKEENIVVGGTFTGDNGTRTGTITFPETGDAVVSDLNLTSYISMPVFGKKPETEKEGAQYDIAIKWRVTESNEPVPDNGTFTYFDKYTATVTLTPKPGYTFTSAQKGKFFYAGKDVTLPPETQTVEKNGGEASLTIKFDSVLIDLPFSGIAGQDDSVIDVIREAKKDKPLTLNLETRVMERVYFGDSMDFGAEGGLILTLDNSPAEVTIDAQGRVIALVARPNKEDAALITVGNGVTLTLRNITLRGVANNTTALIVVEGGGELILGEGVELSDNTVLREGFTIPGGLWIRGGKAVMKGAVITRNHGMTGGGVVIDGGEFEMNGGEISWNESELSGGGVMVNVGKFTMLNGKIMGNKILKKSGSEENRLSGRENGGGGVWVLGEFTMEGGEISGNEAEGGYGGGVFINGMDLEPISDKWNRDVSTFTKTGGTIKGNRAEDKHGKEVYATVWDYNDYKFSDVKCEDAVTAALTYKVKVTGTENNISDVDTDDFSNWMEVPDREGILLASRGSDDKSSIEGDDGTTLKYQLRKVFKEGGAEIDMFMGATEIPHYLWKAVRDRAPEERYIIANAGQQGGIKNKDNDLRDMPVTDISWQDAVVWCNLFSRLTGRTPVYKRNGTVVQASADVDADTLVRDPTADGFWLPTAEEWAYAAKGGKPSASAADDWNYDYAGSNTIGDVAVYNYNTGNTASVGSKDANRLGLYDMSGNVWELCEDKVIRGGGWDSSSADECKVISKKSVNLIALDDPDDPNNDPLAKKASNVGFRVACRP